MTTIKLNFTGIFSNGNTEVLYENENIECKSLRLTCDYTGKTSSKKELWNELKSLFPSKKLIGFKNFCIAYDAAISDMNDFFKK